MSITKIYRNDVLDARNPIRDINPIIIYLTAELYKYNVRLNKWVITIDKIYNVMRMRIKNMAVGIDLKKYYNWQEPDLLQHYCYNKG